MDLSVVIACKNEARHIGAMLDSLARQSWNGAWEVLVADNGSTDTTSEVVEGYMGRLPQLSLIDASAEDGYGPARNLAVGQAGGQKIVFVDGDDEVNEEYVGAMSAALDVHPLVCARIGFDRLNPGWVLQMWPRPWQQEGPQDNFAFLPFAGSGTLGVRRALFEEMGGFRHYRQPSQFEEADFCWRIQLAGHPPPVLVPGAVLHYRLPRSLTAVYRRGRNYARGQRALHALYGDRGMPAPRPIAVRDVAGAIRRIRSRRDLARAVQTIGQLVGQRSETAPASSSSG